MLARETFESYTLQNRRGSLHLMIMQDETKLNKSVYYYHIIKHMAGCLWHVYTAGRQINNPIIVHNIAAINYPERVYSYTLTCTLPLIIMFCVCEGMGGRGGILDEVSCYPSRNKEDGLGKISSFEGNLTLKSMSVLCFYKRDKVHIFHLSPVHHYSLIAVFSEK